MDEKMEPEELDNSLRLKEAHSRAVVLEMIGDILDAEIKPPENVLFVCKLNPVTQDEDLETIFSRFGKITSAYIIRDYKTGDSLCYTFIEFETQEACEAAYFKMDNVLLEMTGVFMLISAKACQDCGHAIDGLARGIMMMAKVVTLLPNQVVSDAESLATLLSNGKEFRHHITFNLRNRDGKSLCGDHYPHSCNDRYDSSNLRKRHREGSPREPFGGGRKEL
ncbi:hypothetical protein L7F22_028984 [Adiantum nelumboides]|nr:hypothetical protein [Adiantum nelumboides]